MTLKPQILASERRLSKRQALQLTETAYLSATTALIWISFYYLPVGGGFLRIALPLPLILLQLRQGQRCAIEGLFVTVLLLTTLMGPIRGSIMLFPYGILAIWLGLGWYHRLNWWITWGVGIIIGSLGFVIRLTMLSILVGENLWMVITHSSTDFLEYIAVSLKLGFSPSFSEVQSLTITFIFLQNLIYVFTVHVIAYWTFSRLDVNISEPPSALHCIVNGDHF
uniref:DUF2232 domain-containing protein n=1 Tax=Paulinella chromatophora TaxID=39717 RepID=B1X5D8_PAUCH|nr:hypothetical protein PCC_0742 [Paulinella chromatophora]ACB43157.1 hypothetical protein PCC_0742 [Paulinella chromatophora]